MRSVFKRYRHLKERNKYRLVQWRFCNSHLKCHGVAAKRANFPTRIKLPCTLSGTLPSIRSIPNVAAAIVVGTSMKSANAAHLPDEHFVIRVDHAEIAMRSTLPISRRGMPSSLFSNQKRTAKSMILNINGWRADSSIF
jgi:hypothetical protein